MACDPFALHTFLKNVKFLPRFSFVSSSFFCNFALERAIMCPYYT